MGWREEVDVVLQAWIASEGGGGKGGRRWQRVGSAREAGPPGQFVVDVRSTRLTADQADDLRLAGPDAKRILDEGFPQRDRVARGGVACAAGVVLPDLLRALPDMGECQRLDRPGG